ncbi:hypothetical protein V2J09_022716 [Rumex salicifolius]
MMEDSSTPTKECSSPAKSIWLVSETKKTMAYAYGLMATFVVCTLLILLYNPSSQSTSSSSPWYFKDIFHIKHSPNQFSSLFSHFLPNSSQQLSPDSRIPNSHINPQNASSSSSFTHLNGTQNHAPAPQPTTLNRTDKNQIPPSSSPGTEEEKATLKHQLNSTSSNSTNSTRNTNTSSSQMYDYESMSKCDLFDGKWVRDDSYPLYAAGSCPHVDEPFNCFLNSRPDNGYERYRWQPNNCNIPRLKGKDMLQLIRGKRLVFVGDSLNRNMWDSLVCILKNSVEDKSSVFEASGRHEFRTEGSYSFIFKDYNCSVEFFRSPFLVQEWESPNRDGSKNETLRLDVVERSSDRYKNADILIFNSGHWWTHDKNKKGQNYYQEGSHVYGALNVAEAYRRAMTTWGRWVDSNVNPMKTQVFFRGYSATHFRGGKWNSGGRCENETEPFKTEKYLLKYPTKMKMFESVMKGMKSHVYYLNITRMTDYRKDAHPAVFRAQHLSEEERRDPLRFQDCSHWCLPGVPDTWNEILYSQILINHYKKHKQKTTT